MHRTAIALLLAATLLPLAAIALPRNPYSTPKVRSYTPKAYKAPKLGPSYHRGYVNKSGTYVMPYYQTAPNRTKVDNWTSKPNVNPYTGKPGTKDPYAVGH